MFHRIKQSNSWRFLSYIFKSAHSFTYISRRWLPLRAARTNVLTFATALLTKRFSAVVKTQKRRSKKIYNTELTITKIENQVKRKYWADPHRTRLTMIAELTWSNLGLKEVLKK